MKVIVIGAGLIGLTSAYLLRLRGHEVTLMDRQPGPGLETSYANGALITPSMPEPWNRPGSGRVLLRSLTRADSPLKLRLHAVPSMAAWGIGFLRNSKAANFQRNTVSNLHLALHSLKVMEMLRQQTGFDYGRATPGSLRVFRDSRALAQAEVRAATFSSEGLRFKRLDAAETVELEPALAPISAQLAGSLHYPSDEVGDAFQFCVALTECARAAGVQFRFGSPVSSLQVRAGQVTAVVSGVDPWVADKYLVAAGSYSTPLLRSAGLNLPVRPAKGYSVTFGMATHGCNLRIPIVDDDLHAVVTPLAGALRVAGTAEFAGYDLSLPRERIQNLTRLAGQVLPKAALDPAAAKTWCGLRAMSMDGVPIIGHTSISNLLISTGHGHLGWTMAAASAELLADIASDVSPRIDPRPYSLQRFA